jgi:NAD(P)-dependent dehydrogenase (short-subunit alcohol dehydrogenase family)
MGSISLAASYVFAQTPAYKVSKAALNMLAAQYALDFEKDGFTVLSISPGVSHNNDPSLDHG